MRGNLIFLADMVAEMDSLEQVCIHFLDDLPTDDWSSVRHLNRVLRVERGHGGGIVVVHCIVYISERAQEAARLFVKQPCLFVEQMLARQS